jgi:peptide/nickel transport system ATP-binding protein
MTRAGPSRDPLRRVAAAPILSVRDLVVEVPTERGRVRLLDAVSFDVFPDEVFGVVGESGSGKSVTMLAAMGLLQHPVELVSGQVLLHGEDVSKLSFEQMRAVRGKRMAMVFQDPMTSLNPVRRIGAQIAEAVRLHNRDLSAADIRKRVIELLGLVSISDPERRARQFPNEFSGGMRQRAMIAMAMANEPDLLIADEPTTALDVTIQAQIMEVLAQVRRRTGAAMVLITHDLGLVAEVADRVAVMYGGRMTEHCSVDGLFKAPRHPYTVGLMASLPRADADVGKLYSIPGQVPDLAQRPPGCAFHPRCGLSKGREPCRTVVPALRPMAEGHAFACHFAEETPAWSVAVADSAFSAEEGKQGTPQFGEVVLKVEGLTKEFPVRRVRSWRKDRLRAVNDVSFSLRKGETLGLVGESGCGKSTLGRVILQLHKATRGAIYVRGDNVVDLGPIALRGKRRQMQIVFQDPYSSLDPRMTVHEILAEPLRINRSYDPARIPELLGHVGLAPDAASRRPPQFSGGQRQRIAIARALALRPDLMVLDEPVSALDVSIQAQVVNLLKQLQKELGLALLFISHDLSVVRHISDRVAVMYLGRLVEMGSREQVFDAPAHPYTQALLSAIPRPVVQRDGGSGRIVLKGDPPNPMSPPSGCVFRTRCINATELCAQAEPALEERTGAGHLSACHYAAELFGDRRDWASDREGQQ